MTDIYAKAIKLSGYITGIRRKLHSCPELGFEEFQTQKIILAELKKLGIPAKVCAKTGIVALLKGAKPGKTIALRADMDALPVNEETGLSFASKNPGRMHACGHDAHMACALGTAKLLSSLKKELKGKVKFIFQPFEEMGEESLDGAKVMVKEGAMKNPKPDAVVALHVMSYLKSGYIGLNYGKVFANADIFEIKIIGVGGHGSTPEKCIDPIVASAAVIMNLQSIVSRTVSPHAPSVLSITMIKGGETSNVIPPEVKLMGTVRTLDEKTRQKIKKVMTVIIKDTAHAYGASSDFKYTDGYPFFENDPRIFKLVETAGTKLLGKDKVIFSKTPSMGGENFGHFAKVAPGCFFILGTANPNKQTVPAIHNPKFDIDESALPVGVSVLAKTCLDFLA